MTLDELLAQAADKAEADGVAIDGAFGGPVYEWVAQNVSYAGEQEFFIVALLTAELNDRQARREGYANQIDRACKLASSKCPPARNIFAGYFPNTR